MTLQNSLRSYRNVAAQTASPGNLVLMLFDGAIRFLEHARLGFRKEDPAEFNEIINNNVQRAQAIIQELNASLNIEQGGELATNLRSLYNYLEWRLQESNMRKQEDGIREVIDRLSVIREAWSGMLFGPASSPVFSMPGSTQPVAA